MIHHSNVPYAVALDDAAKKFKVKLEETIHNARASTVSVINKVISETPNDRIAHTQSMEFAVGPDTTLLMGLKNRKAKGYFQEGLHKHALGQVAERAGVPGTYLNRLLARPYGPQLLVENLTTIFQKEDDQKFLVRSVGGQVRGVVSSAFKRMDSGPIIESFAKACESIGAEPVEGTGGDLRWAIKAVLPMVFQPSAGGGRDEVISFGVQLSNSDFGCGTLSLSAFVTRLMCTNHMTMASVLREVHLGKRLSDDLEYSAETYRADTKVQVLAVRDMVQAVLAPEKVNAMVVNITKALEQKIDPKTAWAELPKHGMLKGEVDAVKELFNDAGVEQLPSGTSPARLSNAISWFAKSAPTAERRLELEALAGKLLVDPIALKEAA